MFSHRSEGKPVCIADIGDGSVSVALVLLAKDAPAHVIVSMREMLTPEERPKAQACTAILGLLESVTTKLLAHPSAKAYATPRAIYAAVHAPWTSFRTRETEEKTEPRVITKSIISALAQQALTEKASETVPLEAGVLHVFLNGYPTGEPLGKRATSIRVVAFDSTIDATMKTGITDIFGKLLPGRVPVLYSGMRSLLVTMQAHMPDLAQCIVIDVGGIATSCAVVRKDALTDTASIPEGLSTILRRIAPTALPEETLSLMRMLASETCSTSACTALKEKIALSEPELVRLFGENFAVLSAKRRLPNKALLSAPAELSPWLESFFSRIDFSQFTTTTQPLQVESLSPEHLTDVITWEPGIVQETGIGIAASAVNILAHSA